MKTLLAQDLGLIDSTGRRMVLSAEAFLRQYRQGKTWRYLGLVLVVLLVSDPMGIAGQLPMATYILAWLAGIACYLGSQALLMLGLALLRPGLPCRTVYWPLVSLLAMAPTLLLLERGLALVTDAPPALSGKILYLLVVTVMFETIFMRFVYAPLPGAAHGAPADAPAANAAASTSSEGAEPAATRGRILLIGAQPVPLDAVVYLEARQHHVCARLRDRELTLRTRLSDVIAQTREEDGVQTHRSWWVARQAIKRLEREDGKPVLRLCSDGAVPVARGRLAEVERWCAAHLEP